MDDEDRKLHRQQNLALVIGGVSLLVVVAVAIGLAIDGVSGGSWWTLVGSSLTAVAMCIMWFNLRSIRRTRSRGDG